VDFILGHLDDYKPFFVNEENSSGGSLDQAIEKYCDKMCKDGEWAGHMEMNALANMLGFNIIIHQYDRPPIEQIFHEPKEEH
jgi:OTU domain-containing protein 3